MSELKAHVVRPSDLTSDEVELWRSFVHGTPATSVAFLSHAYSLAAQSCFFGVQVAKLMRSGVPVGFFPFQFRTRFHRSVGAGQRISGGLADYFGVVGAADLRIERQELLRAAGLKTLYFDHLDESQAVFGLAGVQPEPGLRVEFPEGGQAFWKERKQRDKKFTSDTERRERKLIESHGPLRFTFRHENPTLELERLIDAKRQQYARTGVKDSMASASTRRFLQVLSAVDDPDCRATLSTLHAGNSWVCSHFGLMCGNTLHYWFPVYNPEMRAFAPGRLLVKAIIDASDETNVRLIDRGSGDSQAKQDFATSRHLYYRGVWQRRGIVSLAYRAGLSANWKLKAYRSRAAPAPTVEKPT